MLPLILKYPKTSAAIVVVVGIAAVLAARKAASTLADVPQAINPLNRDNVFNQTFNDVTQAITGDPSFSFGSWVFDLLNPGYDKDYYVTPYPNNPARDATRSESAGPMPNLSELMIP